MSRDKIEISVCSLLLIGLPLSWLSIRQAAVIHPHDFARLSMVVSAECRILIFLILGSGLSKGWRRSILFESLFWVSSVFLIVATMVALYVVEITGVSANQNFTMLKNGGEGLRVTLNAILPGVIQGLDVRVVAFGFTYAFLVLKLGRGKSFFLHSKPATVSVLVLSALVWIEQASSPTFKNSNDWIMEQNTALLYVPLFNPKSGESEKERSYPIRIQDFKRRDWIAHEAPQAIVDSPPNVYIFVIESLAHRFMTEVDMPNLHSLQKDSLSSVFSFSNANGTHHAWYAILASDYPINYLSARKTPEWMGSPPLLLFKRLGYQLTILDSAGLDYLGYDKFILGPGLGGAALIQSPMDLLTHWDQTDSLAMDRLLQEVQEIGNRKKLFLTFLGATHFPYLWPGKISDPMGRAPNYLRAKFSKKEQIKFIDQYRASARFIDLKLGRFIQELKRKDLYHSSLIAVCGDHGEELFENGSLGHGSNLKNEQTAVPIVLKIPGINADLRTHVISQVNILPTLLESIGVEHSYLTKISVGTSVLRPPKEGTFALINKVNGYTQSPEEFVLTDGTFKAAFRVTVKGSERTLGTLILQEIYDMNDRIVPGLNTVEKMRNCFQTRFIPGLKQMNFVDFL